MNRPTNKTCSISCRMIALGRGNSRPKVAMTCDHCAKPFHVQPSRLTHQNVRYCSRQCFDDARAASYSTTCAKCGQAKGPGECQDCRSKRRRANNRTPDSRRLVMIDSAKKRDLPYRLTREQFMSFWQKPCTYCGDAIETVGLDRIDNAKGYVIGNVTPCCGTCNAMKSTQSMDEFLDRCRRIVKQFTGVVSC